MRLRGRTRSCLPPQLWMPEFTDGARRQRRSSHPSPEVARPTRWIAAPPSAALGLRHAALRDGGVRTVRTSIHIPRSRPRHHRSSRIGKLLLSGGFSRDTPTWILARTPTAVKPTPSLGSQPCRMSERRVKPCLTRDRESRRQASPKTQAIQTPTPGAGSGGTTWS